MGNTGSQPNRPLTEEGSVNLTQWDEEYQGPLVEQDEEPQQPSFSSRLVSQPSSSRKSWPTSQGHSDYTRLDSSGPDPSSPLAFDLDPWEEIEYHELPDRSQRRRFRAELRAQREPSYETYVRNARARVAAGRGVSASPPAPARRSASATSRSRTPQPTSPDYELDEEQDLAQGTNPPRPARTSRPRRATTPDLPDYEDYEEDELAQGNANPPPPAGTNAPRCSLTPDLPDYEDYEQEENANDPFRHSNRELWQRQQDERFRQAVAAREANSTSDSSSDRRPRAGNDSEDEIDEIDEESDEEENNDPCAQIRRERDQLRDALALARADLRAEQARRLEEQFLLDQVTGGADAANAQVDRLRLENQRLRRALVRRGWESDYESPSASSSSPSSRQRTQSQTPTPAGRARRARGLVAVEPSPPPQELLDMLPAATIRRMNTRSQVAEGGRTPPRGLWSPQRGSRAVVGAGVSRGGGRGAVKKPVGKGRRAR